MPPNSHPHPHLSSGSFQLMLSRMTPFAFMRPARSWRSAKVVATEV